MKNIDFDSWLLVIGWIFFVCFGTFGVYTCVTASQRDHNWTSQDHIDYLMGRRDSGPLSNYKGNDDQNR